MGERVAFSGTLITSPPVFGFDPQPNGHGLSIGMSCRDSFPDRPISIRIQGGTVVAVGAMLTIDEALDFAGFIVAQVNQHSALQAEAEQDQQP